MARLKLIAKLGDLAGARRSGRVPNAFDSAAHRRSGARVMSYIGRMPLVRSRIVFGTTSHGGPRPATTACHSAISFLGNPRPVHTTLICPPACLPARPPYRRHLYLFSAPARLHAPLPSRHSVGRLSSEGLVQLHAARSRRQSVCCPGRAYVALSAGKSRRGCVPV